PPAPTSPPSPYTTLFRSDESHGGDPMAVFDAPADGTYTLLVRDLQYRGGGDYAYRIDAGEVPYVESLLPKTGRRGQKVEVTAVRSEEHTSELQSRSDLVC